MRRFWLHVLVVAGSLLALVVAEGVVDAFRGASDDALAQRFGGAAIPLGRAALALDRVNQSPVSLRDFVSATRTPWVRSAIRWGGDLWDDGFGRTLARARTRAEEVSAVPCSSTGFGMQRCSFRVHVDREVTCSFGVSVFHSSVSSARLSCIFWEPGRSNGAPIVWTRQDASALLGRPVTLVDRAHSAWKLGAAANNGAVLADADAHRARLLGEVRPVAVPEALRESYDLLMSRESLTFGNSCGDPGSTTRGSVASAALREAGRLDLLENVARGPNPAGRIFGIVALRDLDPAGARWDKDRLEPKIGELGGDVPSCGGCVMMRHPAGALLRGDTTDRQRLREHVAR